jgi:NAD(P)-dependent dehydrogenase (short-subunit alcohol dehydrogenase family)
MSRSFVVTEGGRGIDRASVERLLGDAGNHAATVVAIELDLAALAWTDHHPAGRRVLPVAGDADDPAVADRRRARAGRSSTSAPTRHAGRSRAHCRIRRPRRPSKG